MRKLKFTEIQWVAQGLTANRGRHGSSSAPKYLGLIRWFLGSHPALWPHRRYSGKEKKKKIYRLEFQYLGFGEFIQPGLRCQIAGGIPDCRHTLQAFFGDWLLLDLQWGCQCQKAEMTAVRPDFQRSLASNGYGPLSHRMPYWIL